MKRRRVLIAGGGVAALETLLGLRALAGERVEITVLAPDGKFVNRSMAVDRPAVIGSTGALKLRDITDEQGADWHRGSVHHVDPQQHLVVTDRGHELRYDDLVVAVGARAEPVWRMDGVLTFRDGRDAGDYRHLLRRLEAGRVTRVAFVKPRGMTWPLPLYELALTTAAECELRDNEVQLTVVTPEAAPLELFGASASVALSAALREAGVRLHVRTTGAPSRPGRLHLSPGAHPLAVDRIVTIPRLTGPELPGVPSDAAGFMPTDRHGRVLGVRDIFAAGDATVFGVKQGGIAAQQAEAVAHVIASAAGAQVFPRPFRPVLRGLLRVAGTPLYLRTPLTDGGGRAAVSHQPLWWPPNRLCGRYLAPYLSQAGGAGVMFHQPGATHARGEARRFTELADLQVE